MLIEKAEERGFRYSVFREPDLGGRITAAAFEPAAYKICRGLPLALLPSTEIRVA
jgi:hypothetical protein